MEYTRSERGCATAMHLLDLTLSSPAENLALDEALLDSAETMADGSSLDFPDSLHSGRLVEVLRLWEPRAPFVVLGRGSRIEQEVDLEGCERLGVPVLRRASGGAAVVVGPGCLMYAVVLSYDRRPELRPLDSAHGFVLSRVAEAVAACAAQVAPAGTSDLVVAPRFAAGHASSGTGALAHGKPLESGSAHVRNLREAGSGLPHRKFSGNSLRCKRRHFLYHGTLMYDFDISLIASCLHMPPRQPDYRQGRSHVEFLANLPASGAELRRALGGAWQATRPLSDWPRQQTAQLAESRHSCRSWIWSR